MPMEDSAAELTWTSLDKSQRHELVIYSRRSGAWRFVEFVQNQILVAVRFNPAHPHSLAC